MARPNDTAASGLCPVCELPCDKLVLDAEGTPQESEMCEPCHRVTEIIAADAHFLTDPKYNLPGGHLANLQEELPEFMRRMHGVLL